MADKPAAKPAAISLDVPVVTPAPSTPAPWHVIPNWNIGTVATAATQAAAQRADLAQTGTDARAAETQLTINASGGYLRFGYGIQRVGAMVLRPLVGGNNLYPYYNYLALPYVIGRGPIQGVDAVQFDGKPMPAGVFHTVYTGTQTQGIDDTLQRAYSSQGITYADRMLGIAYGVLLIPPGPEFAFSQITVDVRWNLCWDPRISTAVWTQNPALALADFIVNPDYGRGEAIDWTTVAIAANKCDETMSDGERRRWFGLVIDRPQTLDAWEETLRAYAGVFVYREGGVTKFHVDWIEAPSFSFTNATPANYINKSLTLRSKGRDELPTVVTVNYTDTSQDPWATVPWTEKAPGVDDGSVEFREAVIEMPGIQSHSMARREALRHLNEYITCDLIGTLVATGEGIAVQKGQVVTATDSAGLVAKPMRVTAAKPVKPGRWSISLVEYQDALYQDVVATGPQIPDTVFPLPFSPTAPTSLTLTEDVYQLQTGLYASRILVAWAEPVNFPFVASYFVEVLGGGVLEDSGTNERGATTFTTKALVENIAHTVNVYTISTTGARSAAISASLTNSGKLGKPSDVPTFTGLEIGGEVRLMWQSATDLDLTAHEIRYGTTASVWDTASLLDRIATPAVRYNTRIIPEGEWRFFIKGLDSVRSERYPYGQESINATTLDLTVTTDASAFLAGQYAFTNADTLINMRELVDYYGRKYWVTDMGESWNSLFPGTMNSYTQPLSTYHSPGLSEVKSAHHNFGGLFTGDWGGTVDYDQIGIPSVDAGALINLDTSDGAYPTQAGINQSIRTTAQWGYTAIFAPGAATLLVRSLGEIHVSVVTRDEGGRVAFTGTQPTIVNLNGKYTALTSLILQAQGVSGSGAPATAYDRVAVNPNASGCLQFELDNNATAGNHYSYWSISNTGYVIASGDFLEYEYLIANNGLYSDDIGGMEIDLTTSPNNARSAGCVDANGDIIMAPTAKTRGYANGVWQARKISLTPIVGKTASSWNVVSESDVASAHIVCLYRNIRVTDGAGTLRQSIWTSGPAPINALAYHALVVGGSEQLQQANSFDAYLYNSQTGAAIAGNAYYSASGV